MTFKAMKFRVESPEHSEKIQKVLFDMGYCWYYIQNPKCKIVTHTHSNYLWAEKDGTLSKSDSNFQLFLDDGAQEYTLKQIISYELVPTQKPEEYVELNGLKYKKSGLEEALKLIKPVEEEK